VANQRIHPTEKGLRKLHPGDLVFLQGDQTLSRQHNFTGRFVRFAQYEDGTLKNVVIEDQGIVIHFPVAKLGYCLRYRP
jgi:hypothetical protein